MGNRAVFLDRDGVVCRDVHYCCRAEDFEILPGVAEAIGLLNRRGFKVAVITNQSGIARGYLSEETLARIHEKMEHDFGEHGARVDAIYYCPHHPDDGCGCRKPKTALFLKAAKALDIDLDRSFVIGDMPSDIGAGKALGCKTILAGSNGGDGTMMPDHVASNLLEAARWILREAG